MTIFPLESDEFKFSKIAEEKFEFFFPRTLVVHFYSYMDELIELTFVDVRAIKVIDSDFVHHVMTKVNGIYMSQLLEVVPVDWTEHYVSLDRADLDKAIQIAMPSLRHFIMPFEARTIEVLANKYTFTKHPSSPLVEVTANDKV